MGFVWVKIGKEGFALLGDGATPAIIKAEKSTAPNLDPTCTDIAAPTATLRTEEGTAATVPHGIKLAADVLKGAPDDVPLLGAAVVSALVLDGPKADGAQPLEGLPT